MVLPQDRSPPSTAAYAIASAIVAGLFGYFLGQFSTLGKVTNTHHADDSDISDAEEDLGDLTDKTPPSNEQSKLVLVVRTDLGMTKGKIVNS